MAMKDITDLQVVQAQQRWRDNDHGPWAYEILQVETGQPEKVCYKCMERAADRGLLEYGVSLRTAWLTDKGQALLAGEDISTGFDWRGDRISSANVRDHRWLPVARFLHRSKATRRKRDAGSHSVDRIVGPALRRFDL